MDKLGLAAITASHDNIGVCHVTRGFIVIHVLRLADASRHPISGNRGLHHIDRFYAAIVDVDLLLTGCY